MAKGKRDPRSFDQSPLALLAMERNSFQSSPFKPGQTYAVEASGNDPKDGRERSVRGIAYCNGVGRGLAHFIGQDGSAIWEIRKAPANPSPIAGVYDLGSRLNISMYSEKEPQHRILGRMLKAIGISS
ncbi:MAG: hypothetical protein IIA87_02770 [Nanoarchaeota archaeon]|nr:hypothetical protein [Nanoarchaeota archaeon]